MTPLQRSRRLQAGLAGLGIVGALGASFGIASATHTSSGGQAGSAATSSSDDHRSSHRSGSARTTDDDDSSRSSTRSKPTVTAPQPAAPQATSSGS